MRRGVLVLVLSAGCPTPAPIAAAIEPQRQPTQREPATQLEAIGHAAMLAFLKHDSFPMTPVPATPARSCCEQDHDGRGACAPDAGAWATAAWQALDFGISEAHHFQYAYHPTAPDAFAVSAIGDLDCDGAVIVYTMRGTAVGGKVHLQLVEPPPGSD